MIVPALAKAALTDIHLSLPISEASTPQPALAPKAEHGLQRRLTSGAATGISIGVVAFVMFIIIFGGIAIRRIQLRRRKARADLRKPELDFDIDGPISP